MLHSGLVSITFRELSPVEIIDLVVKAGLRGIEWGGDIHVPHGMVSRATEIGQMTRDAGLVVAAYGSYYKVGVSQDSGLAFERVLESALALQAPTIRVWAGDRSSEDADSAYRARVIRDSQRIADLAQVAGISISLEYHGGTLTDTNASARQFLDEVGHPNVKAYWQPPVGASPDYCVEGLTGVLGRLSNIHVFHWVRSGQNIVRLALSAGAEVWARYLRAAQAAALSHYAMIEFVRDDSPAAFLEDAGVLMDWLSGGGWAPLPRPAGRPE